jgi:hypothetical protein
MVASFWASPTSHLPRHAHVHASRLDPRLAAVPLLALGGPAGDGGIPALHEAPPLSHARMSVSLTSHAFAYASSAFHNFRLAPLVPGCA